MVMKETDSSNGAAGLLSLWIETQICIDEHARVSACRTRGIPSSFVGLIRVASVYHDPLGGVGEGR